MLYKPGVLKKTRFFLKQPGFFGVHQKKPSFLYSTIKKVGYCCSRYIYICIYLYTYIYQNGSSFGNCPAGKFPIVQKSSHVSSPACSHTSGRCWMNLDTDNIRKFSGREFRILAQNGSSFGKCPAGKFSIYLCTYIYMYIHIYHYNIYIYSKYIGICLSEQYRYPFGGTFPYPFGGTFPLSTLRGAEVWVMKFPPNVML